MGEEIYYLIASSSKYFALTLPVLLKSIPEERKRDFYIIVNNNPLQGYRVLDNVGAKFTLDNSWEYSVLIDVVKFPDMYPPEYIFLLHDTCRLGMDFFKKAESFPEGIDAASPFGGQCNIGLFKKSYLLEKKDFILSLQNCTKEQEIQAEGVLFRTAPKNYIYPVKEWEEPYKVVGFQDIYHTGTNRMIEHYPGVDLYKYKSNWGQTSVKKDFVVVP